MEIRLNLEQPIFVAVTPVMVVNGDVTLAGSFHASAVAFCSGDTCSHTGTFLVR